MDTRIETENQEQHPIWKTACLYLVKIIHLALSLLVLLGPFLSNNVLYLTIIVIYCLGCYFFWYKLGYCLCTTVEEYLGEPATKYEDGTKKSFMTTTLQQLGVSESYVSNTFSTIPAISALICLYKINVQHRLTPLPEPKLPTMV